MIEKIEVTDFPDGEIFYSYRGEELIRIEASHRNMEFLMDKINEIIEEVNCVVALLEPLG